MPLFVTVKVAVRGLCQSSVPNSTVVWSNCILGCARALMPAKSMKKARAMRCFMKKMSFVSG